MIPFLRTGEHIKEGDSLELKVRLIAPIQYILICEDCKKWRVAGGIHVGSDLEKPLNINEEPHPQKF